MKYGMKKGAEKFPLMIVLSYSYKCNARCPNCPYNNSDVRKKYKGAMLMSQDIFGPIAREAGKHKAFLRITGGGEPFLHPNIELDVVYAKSEGCRVGIITNGSKGVGAVLDFADVIEFSVDAGTEREYKRVRPGLNWNTLKRNVLEAVAKRKKTKIIASVINQKGVNVERAVNYWKNKVDKVQVRKFLTWGYNKDNSADKIPYLKKGTPCPWLFERLNIDSRGYVTYCGEDIAFEYQFANIKNHSIEEIWKGEEFEDLRAMHLSKMAADFSLCGCCPDWRYRTWERDYWRLIK